jgi:hypothetical protein
MPTVWLIGTAASPVTLTSDACYALYNQSTTLVLTSGIADTSACTCLDHEAVDYPASPVPQGPYLASVGLQSGSVDVYTVSRLYEDIGDAFIIGAPASDRILCATDPPRRLPGC